MPKQQEPFYYCDLCDFKTTWKHTIKRHKRNKHNIGQTFEVFLCNIDNCQHKTKYKYALKKHQREMHDIEMDWIVCGMHLGDDGKICEYKSKTKGNMKKHQQVRHGVGLRWFPCFINGCAFAAKTRSNLKQHQRARHGIDARFFTCNINNCEYVAKTKGHLKSHQEKKHAEALWYAKQYIEIHRRAFIPRARILGGVKAGVKIQGDIIYQNMIL